jgi:hypothetical protein
MASLPAAKALIALQSEERAFQLTTQLKNEQTIELMAQQANSLQSFMSGLLEEKSMTSIEIHSDNARRLKMGSLYGNESSEGDRDHESQLPRCSTLGPMSPWAQARKAKSRWDSIVAEKQLVSPKRFNSPMRITTVLDTMDLPSLEDFTLSPFSEAEESKNSYVTIAELFDEVLAILP